MITLALIFTAILGLVTGYPSLFLFSLTVLLAPMLSIVIFVIIAGAAVLWAFHKYH